MSTRTTGQVAVFVFLVAASPRGAVAEEAGDEARGVGEVASPVELEVTGDPEVEAPAVEETTEAEGHVDGVEEEAAGPEVSREGESSESLERPDDQPEASAGALSDGAGTEEAASVNPGSEERSTPWPMSRPVVQLELGGGGTSIRFGFVAQLQLDWTIEDRGLDGLEQDYSLFFRRLRPDLRGTLFTRDLSYRLYLNIVPGALEMMEFWLAYRFRDQVQLSVGQVKVPFTRYRLNSFQDIPFVDWSNPTRWFGAERQIGLMLHNGVGRPPPIEYQVGLFTGVNARASNAIGMSRAYGERAPNPSSLTNPALPDGFHPEVMAHVGYNPGGINVRTASDFEGGPLRYMVGLSGAWDFNPTPTEDMTFRFAPELLLKAYGFSAQGVFYLGGFDEVAGDGRARLGVLATVLQVGYFFLRRFEVALRYSLVYLLPSLRADVRLRADEVIGSAETPEAAEALAVRYADVGRLVAEHDLGLGLSVYLIGTALILRVDGAMLLHHLLDVERVDGRVRAMLQLAF